ncbi:MAG: hypothetical protein QM775_04655 [Pirellulales bacterium]
MKSGYVAAFHFAAVTFAALVYAACADSARAAGPKIDIVVGAGAAPLEKLAAEETAAILKKLYEAEAPISTSVPAGDGPLVVVGTQASNPAFGQLKLNLPAVVQQDFAVKTYRDGNRTIVAVTAAAPEAVPHAAYELGWRLGVRYFTFGDLYPAEPPALDKLEIDAVGRPPQKRELVHYAGLKSPLDYAPWSADDWQTLLHQLAKLRYRRVVLGPPPVNLGGNMAGMPIAITSDTMGRAAFKGAKTFDNADLSAATSEAARVAAGTKLLTTVREEGKRLGIEVVDASSVFASFDDVLSAIHTDYYLVANSRLDVDERFAHTTICPEILDPVCGEEVGERVQRAFAEYDRATLAVNRGDDQFGLLGPKMLLRHFEIDEPPPGWWKAARTHYLNAMNEMYRANTRAREGGRAFTLYYARRFEFAVEYVNACEAVRRAGLAKRKGDKDAQIAELEKAIDSVTNCCNAMAAVARTPTDRGYIAVMNEYAYRPLLKLLEAADAE